MSKRYLFLTLTFWLALLGCGSDGGSTLADGAGKPAADGGESLSPDGGGAPSLDGGEVPVGDGGACLDADIAPPDTGGPTQLEGAVEKGPFVIGSSVSLSLLDAALHPTGQVFETQTFDDRGEFSVAFRAAGPVALTGNGYYYNEVLGDLSGSPLTLRALYVPSDAGVQRAYINIVTHLTTERIRALVATGQAFPAAVAQAEAELLAELAITGASYHPGVGGVEMSLAGGDSDDDAYLLAVSAVLTQVALNRGEPVDARLQELLNEMALDLADGTLQAEVRAEIATALPQVDVGGVEAHLAGRLAATGAAGPVPDMGRVLDGDRDGLANAVDPCPTIPAQGNDHLDEDGDHVPSCAGDCDDGDPEIGPGQPELCDGVDNDCDGLTDADDPDLPAGPLADNQTAVCAGASKVCRGGRWVEPDYATAVTSGRYQRVEAGCDGLDNNCDGHTDEDLESCGPPTNGCPAGTVVPAGWVCMPAGAFVMGSPGPECDVPCSCGDGPGDCKDPRCGLPAGTCPGAEPGRVGNEAQHRVTLSHSFFLQATEVTQGQWKAAFAGKNPASFLACGDDCPVESVTWWSALQYCNLLSLAAQPPLPECYVLEGGHGAAGDGTLADCTLTVNAPDGNPLLCTGYRLPTEAEWEYAARAGTATSSFAGEITHVAWDCGDDPSMDLTGWYCGDSTVDYAGCMDLSRQGGPVCAGSHPVGVKQPSAWGLYDMLGNVQEWSWDSQDDYPGGPVTDPLSSLDRWSMVARGGSFDLPASFARTADRGSGGYQPDHGESRTGFRPARTVF